METEDLIKPPSSSSSGSENENDRARDSVCEPSGGDSVSANSGIGEDGENGNTAEIVNTVNGDNQGLLPSDFDEDMDISPTTSPVRAELTETIAVTEKVTILSSEMHAENGFANAEEGSGLSNHQEDVPVANNQGTNATALSGAKRPRTTVDEQQPSVRVVFDSLTRESREKLEELLQIWSQWHSQHCLSSNGSGEALESGEATYFPALHFGLDKASAVSFWMDDHTKNPPSKQFIPLDGKSVPVYDRGFSLALTSTDGSGNLDRGFEVLDDSRCFNCGSYSHSLKECPKPRDNVAVSNARKQHKSRRNQNASSRTATRYYQSSPKGKFDGLRPGVLDAETRRLLGLGELDPPPWLNRMREIGYPPGYLDPEDENQPSGITIFADEESKESKETEEGEILDAGHPDPPKKMSVEFPGINAPIPDNADKRRWEAASSSFSLSRNYSYRRYEYSSESISRGHYYEQMRSRDYQDDGPSGCDPKSSPSRSSYSHRYYATRSPRRSPSGWRSPSYGRSLSDREERSTHYDYSNYGAYGSLP